MNTRSNRVVINSSVIIRILLTLCNTGTVTFQPFNKDTHDLFILCIMSMCQLIVFVIYYLLLVIYCYRSFILFIVQSSFFLCSTLLFHCSLFIVQRKDSFLILDHIPGISILLYLLYKNTITIYASQ
jgi:hypothetical protein